jgi:hypothetical protein
VREPSEADGRPIAGKNDALMPENTEAWAQKQNIARSDPGQKNSFTEGRAP